MSDFEAGFTFGDSGGPEVFLEGATFGDAIDEAEKIYPRHTPVVFDGDLFTVGQEGGENFVPNRATSMPRVAHERSGLGTYDAFAIRDSMTEREAHALLLPYFTTTHVGGRKSLVGKQVKQYLTVTKMREAFMTANAKLTKGEAGYTELGVPPSLSMGPNLLPHSLLEEATLPTGTRPIISTPALRKKVFPLAKPFSLPKVPGGVNVCVGSNDACRSTCLLYSGNNPTADSQTMVKLARSTALVMEPEAWIRMWMASIERHVGIAQRDDKVPYIRPNVLSDIPWELICPTIFEMFPELSFYDYTKVAGRRERSNYDLTFSFSGTNMRHTEQELEEGKTVAVVYWLPGACLKKGAPKALVKKYARYVGGSGPRPDCAMVEDYTFLGRPVITGDLHDFRPLDPPGSVVGLTYKIPKVKGKEMREPPASARKFAMVPNARPAKMLVPTFRDKSTGAIIVAGTPDQLGAGLVFSGSPAGTVMEYTG
ncbi:MAG: hypothetical protein GY772_17505 [bacterium]|nr:hypothetical protein [bacterium]